MQNKLVNITVALVIITTGMSFAQTGKFNVAFKTGYFGDQTNDRYRITSVVNPFSLGFHLRYNIQPDFAIQLASESLQGGVRQSTGEELNVQTSITALMYAAHFWRFSPYINYGLNWMQHHNDNNANSGSEMNFLTGVGTDIFLSGNLVYSLEARVHSDGLNYLGWGTSFSIGYRF